VKPIDERNCLKDKKSIMNAWMKEIKDNSIVFDFKKARKEKLFTAMSELQVKGIEAILHECQKHAVTLKTQIAYILATAYHEGYDYDGKSTGKVQRIVPIKEKGSEAYLQSKSYYPFIGRGYVQITWLENYKKYQKIIRKEFGVDIIMNPDELLRVDIAAFVIVHGLKYGMFTGKKLSDYITSYKTDFPNARRVVNWTDKAELISRYAMSFLKCF